MPNAMVLLPHPDSPTMPSVSARWMSKLTPRTAGTSPLPRLVRDRQVMHVQDGDLWTVVGYHGLLSSGDWD